MKEKLNQAKIFRIIRSKWNYINNKKGEEKRGGGSVNRFKKAKKWTEFAVDTASSGLGLAERGKAIVGGAKKPSAWIQHVKDYSKNNKVFTKKP